MGYIANSQAVIHNILVYIINLKKVNSINDE